MPCAASRISGGSIEGMAASAASGSMSSMLNCSRTRALNAGNDRSLWVSRMRRTRFESAFVDRRTGHARVKEPTDERFAQAARWNARLELGDAVAQQLGMQRILRRPPQTLRAGRVDADGGLQRGRAVDREKRPLGQRLACLAPRVERRRRSGGIRFPAMRGRDCRRPRACGACEPVPPCRQPVPSWDSHWRRARTAAAEGASAASTPPAGSSTSARTIGCANVR